MWVKLDDNLVQHPKVLQLDAAAFALYIAGLCWSAKYETDGRIPWRAVRTLSPHVEDTESAVDALLSSGLWEHGEDGYRIHDFLEYQFSKEQNEARRKADAERQARADSRRDSRRTHGVTHSVTHGVSPSVPDPDPVPESKTPLPPFPQSSSTEPDEHGGAAPAPPERAGRAKRTAKATAPPGDDALSAAAQAVRKEIRSRLGIDYGPEAFDVLEAALRAGSVDEAGALSVVRHFAADEFWCGKVKLAPRKIFKPKHLPELLAKARAAQSRTGVDPSYPYRRLTAEELA